MYQTRNESVQSYPLPFPAAGDIKQSYSIINNILRSRIVVDIDCDATQGSDFRRELGEARVVLALALIGVRHGGGLL
jgi:hypothetical protein